MTKKLYTLLYALFACCFLVPTLAAQCAAGTVLWVRDTVNANVGTAASPSGVSALCASSTVAGAAYGDPNQPFGIQAAMYCTCPGASIRILPGANNYDSTSASWTNRVASKLVELPKIGLDTYLGFVSVEGWSDTSTPCLSTYQANCPVELDFAGGTSHGFFMTSGGNPGNIKLAGLWLRNADTDCVNANALGASVAFALKADGCGDTGLELINSGWLAMDLYTYGNGGFGSQIQALTLFVESHNNGNAGVNMQYSMSILERGLSYDNTGAGFTESSADQVLASWLTATGNGNSGYNGGTGDKINAGLAMFAMPSNGRYAAESYGNTTLNRSRKAMFYCLASWDNALGDFDPASPPFPEFAVINGAQITATPFSFPNAPLFQPDPALCAASTNCNYDYPGTATNVSWIPGATPNCSGGVTLQPVRRWN